MALQNGCEEGTSLNARSPLLQVDVARPVAARYRNAAMASRVTAVTGRKRPPLYPVATPRVTAHSMSP